MDDQQGPNIDGKQQSDVFGTSDKKKFQNILRTSLVMDHLAMRKIVKKSLVTTPNLKSLKFQRRNLGPQQKVNQLMKKQLVMALHHLLVPPNLKSLVLQRKNLHNQ